MFILTSFLIQNYTHFFVRLRTRITTIIRIFNSITVTRDIKNEIMQTSQTKIKIFEKKKQRKNESFDFAFLLRTSKSANFFQKI